MEIILALDIGLKRTGIARSDALGILIKAFKTIETNNIIQELDNIKQDYLLSKIIIGIPVNLENNTTELMIKAKAQEIQNKFPDLEIIFENETCSSKEAETRLKSRDIQLNKDNKGLIDAEAAAIILEQYFNYLAHEGSHLD